MNNLKRANINAAAKRIAETLGMVVESRCDGDSSKMRVTWELKDKDANSHRYARVELTCEPGYGAEGDWWKGYVTVVESPDVRVIGASKTIGSERLVSPFGRHDGPRACRDTRREFCRYAEKFKPEYGRFV